MPPVTGKILGVQRKAAERSEHATGLLPVVPLSFLTKPRIRVKMKIAPKITWLLVTFLILILFTPLLFLPQLKVYASPSFIRDLTLGWGLWSYLIYVLIFILSVPLPLPSGPLALAGGYLFGIFWGSLLALLGLFVGSSISFIVARKFGQPLVEKLIDKHHIIHFNHL